MGSKKPTEAAPKKPSKVELAPDIYVKIFNVQQAIAMAQKGGTHANNQYKYARETDIINAVKPHLGAQRLIVTSTTLAHETVDKMKKVQVQFTLTDIDNKTSITSTFFGEGEDKSGSVVGTPIAYTMALKYFLAKFFIVETGDDAEIEKRKSVANESKEVKFDKAKKMLAKMKDVDGLIQYAEMLKENKTFSKEQIAELNSVINSRVDELNDQ